MKLKPPNAPPHLSPAARREWRAIQERWVFDPSSNLILRGAFEAWDIAQRARVELEAAPSLTIQAGEGMPRQHPALKTFLDATREARMAFQALKLDPPHESTASWPAVHREAS